MTLPAAPTPEPVNQSIVAQGIAALPVCQAHCHCNDRWHLMWSALKGMGLLQGMLTQTGLLRDILTRHWTPGGTVLIAGAADTGSWDMLRELIGSGVSRFTVLDPCEAPLQLVRDKAAMLGQTVETIHAIGQQLDAESAWNLIFIHYTLAFLDRPGRLKMLRQLARALKPGGVILCSVRYRDPIPPDDRAQLARWIDDTASDLRRHYGDDPKLRDAMLAALPDYALGRHLREREMPDADTVALESGEAGLRVLAIHDDDTAPRAQHPKDLTPALSIRKRILVLSATD